MSRWDWDLGGYQGEYTTIEQTTHHKAMASEIWVDKWTVFGGRIPLLKSESSKTLIASDHDSARKESESHEARG